MVEQTVSIIGILKDGISPAVGKIDRAFIDLGARVRGIGGALSPLTSGIAQLAAVVGGSALIGKALDVAEKKLAVDQRLLAALNGQVGALQKISDIANNIEGKTLFDSDDLKAQGATLINMGVAIGKVEERLTTATDVATGLGVPIEAAVKSIGKFESNQAGELGKLIPQLRQLQEAGTLSTEGVPLLQRLFGGQAEAAAGGITGQLFRARDDIEDTLGDIGKQLIKIKAAILESLAEPLHDVSEFVQSPAGQSVVDIFTKLAPPAVKAATAVAGLGLSLQAAQFVFGPVAKLTVGLTTEVIKLGVALVGTAATGVVSMVTGLFSLKGALTVATLATGAFVANAVGEKGFKTVGSVIADSTSRIVETFKAVQAGEATFEELTEVAGTEMKVIGKYADVYILQPIKNAFNDAIEFAKTAFSAIGEFYKNIFTFQGLDAAVEARNKILAEKAFSSGIDKAKRELESTTKLDTEVKELRAESEKRIVEIRNEAARQSGLALVDASGQIDKAAKLSVAKIDIAKAQLDATSQAIRGIDVSKDLKSLTPGISNIVKGIDSEFAVPVRELIQRRIVEGIERGSLTANEGVELFRQSELSALEDQKRKIEERIEKEKESLDNASKAATFQQFLVDRMRESGEVGEILTAHEGRLVEAISLQVSHAKELSDLEKDRVRTLLQIEEANDKIRALEAQSATAVVDKVRSQQSALDSRIASIKELEQAGRIDSTESASRQNAATEEFRAKIAASRLELDAMKKKWPEISLEIDKATKELDGLESGLKRVTVEADSFTSGFVDGVNQSAESLDSLRELGASVGRELTDSLTPGLIDVFITGKRTWNDYLADVLAGIGELLIKYALLNTVKSAINALDSDADPAASAANGVTSAAAGGAGKSIVGSITDALGLGDSASSVSAATVTVTGQVVNVNGGVGSAAGSLVPGATGGTSPVSGAVASAATPATGSAPAAGGGGLFGGIGSLLSGAGGGIGSLLSGAGGLLGGAGGGIGSLLSGAGGGIGSLLSGAGGGIGGILGGLFGGGAAGGAGGGLLSGLGGLLGGAGGAAGGGILSLLTPILGPLGPILGILLGGLFHEGGMVPGDPSAGDSTLIAAEGGEYVHRGASVNYYGADAMEAINSMSIPRESIRSHMRSHGFSGSIALRNGFHDGGSISGVGRRSRSSTAVARAYVVPDEQSAARWNANSRQAQLDFLGANKHEVITRLGLKTNRRS